ncbi:hypothetical protein C7B64_13665 [Merismopedia glauca CCAP 1448/3]|uniref:Uncharacterized protein n=1 Tax=Merismopedia glauca CCAP 1448/3 TaxID=1296344 RepID=A0A2T1C236_9CYAN|nr:hypothetical protein C7B64_13665 [Merismopedia glauca CCAP 1448/3]
MGLVNIKLITYPSGIGEPKQRVSAKALLSGVTIRHDDAAANKAAIPLIAELQIIWVARNCFFMMCFQLNISYISMAINLVFRAI